MTRSITLSVLLLLFGLGGLCQAAPPKATNLKEAVQELTGKCGSLTEKQGVFEFYLDTLSPREGADCIASIGTDVILFEANRGSGPNLGTPQTYLIVPLERVILRLRQ